MEDEAIVAMMIEGMPEALGCEVVSSVARVAQACEITAKANINLAVLDVNVAGVPVFQSPKSFGGVKSRSCSALAMAQAANQRVLWPSGSGQAFFGEGAATKLALTLRGLE